MAKKKWKPLTKRQMAALRARVDRKTKQEIEVATGIAGWRMVGVLLRILEAKRLLDREELLIIMDGARDGIWSDLPSARSAELLLDLEIAEMQSSASTKH